MASYNCVHCCKSVTQRMHAVCCDACNRWVHRKCNTGISAEQYRQMTRGELEIQWQCRECEHQVANDEPVMEPVPPTPDSPMSPIRELNTSFNVRPADAMETDDVVEDVTFNITDREIQQPHVPLDESLADRLVDDDVPDDVPVTFEVVEGGSKRGGRKLLSSDGYTYTARYKYGDRTYWTCSIRGKTVKCYASVKQYCDIFTRGIERHNHPADSRAGKKVKISKKVKEIAKERVFEPAASIVERVMKDILTSDDVNLPKPENLSRAANHHRRQRPDDPVNLEFELQREFVGEEFVLDDIRVDGQRHIIFANQNQLHHLRQAKRWFIDGTFKLVKQPFHQLSTIHCFVKKGDDVKQVPLVYVLMSRRTKQDYVEVFQSIRSRLGEPMVEWFMLDFEAATWQAIREVFPGTIVKGCVFHWTQRVYRKIQDVGLATAYIQKGDKYEFLRKLMSLPYLPPEHIPGAFNRLKEVNVPEAIQRVIEYVERTWVNGSLWRPENWSVFREPVRTNNDVEDTGTVS